MSGPSYIDGEKKRLDTATTTPLLEVKDLQVEFRTARGRVQALRGVNLQIPRGETLAVLGESGSGKSVTARVVLGILQSPPGYVMGGSVQFDGADVRRLKEKDLISIQGDRIAMVFQDALAALNPVFTVGWQIAEIFKNHRGRSMREGMNHAVDLLRRVGIPNPEARVHEFPHQFSGGMRQRVMIAMAIALKPDLLIADEPTTALDVTVQAQILQLLARMRREGGMSLMLITHDVAVAAEVADHVAVMYAGRIVEIGAIDDILAHSAHPYTRALIALASEHAGHESRPIPGSPPDMISPPPGCAFHPRCPHARPVCATDDPALRTVAPGQSAACHFANEVRAHALAPSA